VAALPGGYVGLDHRDCRARLKEGLGDARSHGPGADYDYCRAEVGGHVGGPIPADEAIGEAWAAGQDGQRAWAG
jgi:hypothetical protein